jgi:hypothetical protein
VLFRTKEGYCFCRWIVPENEANSSLASPLPWTPSMRRKVKPETSIRIFVLTLVTTSGASFLDGGSGRGAWFAAGGNGGTTAGAVGGLGIALGVGVNVIGKSVTISAF